MFSHFFLDRLCERWPGLRFIRDYSPKTYNRREIVRKIMSFVSSCKVEGDYLEFGVYKGSTFVEVFKMAQSKGLEPMRFFAFDSFQGLPQIEGVDKSFNQFSPGEFSVGHDTFKSVLNQNKVDLDKVTIVPGWFKDTLNAETKIKLALKYAAVVWIDCDLYESTVPVLEFITDLVGDGTVLIFDDWYFYKGRPDMGERKAFAEWLERNRNFSITEFHKYFWHGNSFILHKK